MKVTLKKDQTKVEQLGKFLMNWESVLAGFKAAPLEENLQAMF